MDEDGIPDVLKTERMGHELADLHGVSGHVSPAMRASSRPLCKSTRRQSSVSAPCTARDR
jgi:hypothetical protein